MAAARVVVVGAGFAGYNAARGLLRHAPDAEVVLINPTDYFLYLPLLPEVATGVLEPRRVCVSLPDRLAGVRLVLGKVDTSNLPIGSAGSIPKGVAVSSTTTGSSSPRAV